MRNHLNALHNQVHAIKISEKKINKNNSNNKKDYIIAGFFLILLGLFVAIRFDYYYDLNDDMLMKDIISGSYTGEPNGHNIQMLFPISWFLSLFYQIVRQTSWYGLFFVLCHFGCFYAIALRTQHFFTKLYEKIAVVLLECIFIFSFLLYEIVFVQYTVTAGLLGATAAFLLYTTDAGLSTKKFIQANIPSILLVIVAFQVRSEMLLLIFPLICVVGVWKWSEEKELFSKESFKRYLPIIGAILIGMLLSEGIHAVAYGNAEWKEFNALFDSRTELYDFQQIPAYEGNEAFYQSIGLAESEQKLFENYNYGIDTKINAKTMEAVATYAKENRKSEQPFVTRLRESIKSYLKITFLEQTKIPWNYLILLSYFLVLIMAIYRSVYTKTSLFATFWKLLLLFSVRSALWIYIVYGNRMPPRITHTLYATEVLILCAMLITLGNKVKERIIPALAFIILIGFTLRYAPSGLQYVETEYARREEVNREYLQLQDYCAYNKQNVYFLDVYSTVAYSEKLFKDVDNSLKNYEFLGGWACMSPCNYEKLETLGISSIEEGITSQSKVYVISHAKREVDWLQNFLQDKGYELTPKCVDIIGVDGQEAFKIYQIVKV